MTKIYIYKENDCKEFETNNVLEFLKGYFKKWPKSASVYEDCISPNNKIDIRSAKDLHYIAEVTTSIHVVVYPQGLVAIAVGFLIATGAAILLSSKSKKETAERKVPTAGSPNNGLSARENSERINARIPDIYGKVRSVPDLIVPPYIVYKNNQEVEYSLMVIGRGSYDVSDVRDDETLVSKITGASVQVYAPGQYNSTAQLTVGANITEPIVATKKSNSVNGQKMLAPNTTNIYSAGRFKFFNDGSIQIDNTLVPSEGPDKIFTPIFDVGDPLTINVGSLVGTYTIASVSDTELFLQNYSTVNANWLSIPAGGVVQSTPMTLYTEVDRSVGPFILDNASNVYCNFVCEGGLYKDNGTEQVGLNITVEIKVRKVDSSDVPYGTTYTYTTVLNGSAISRARIARTLKSNLGFTDRIQVVAKRLTNRDFTYVGTTSDEIVFESLYAVNSIDASGFSDVTVVKAATFANPGTLAVKARKLNMLVTRKVPIRISGTSFTAITATTNFADIFVAICKDPRIGNLTNNDLDLDNIYQTQTDIVNYFGSTKLKEFCHTFDDENLSFEETASIVAESVFCSVYRQGNKIKLYFERSNTVSRLLFNHRNKLPGTEKRTFAFGRIKDKDGVEVKYRDSKDGAEMTYYIPENQSALNPEILEIAGLQNKFQAYFHANRAWNKIQYKNTVIEFEATQEADLLVRGDRILVADNTRPKTFDGEVISQSGLTLGLSEDFEFEVGQSYTIFLQLADATVQGIAISPGEYANEVVLASSPSIPLTIGSTKYAACTYEIIKNSSVRQRAFLIEEKEPKENFSSSIVAFNYDSRYYQNDDDYTTGVIDLNGDLI